MAKTNHLACAFDCTVFHFYHSFLYIMCAWSCWLWRFSWSCRHCLWINWFNLNVVEHIHVHKMPKFIFIARVWKKSRTKSIQCVHFGIFISFSMVCHHIYTQTIVIYLLSLLFSILFSRTWAAANICVNNSYFFARRQCKRKRIRKK